MNDKNMIFVCFGFCKLVDFTGLSMLVAGQFWRVANLAGVYSLLLN